MESMFYVYILVSLKDGKFYIGFTKDLKRRLREHEIGNVDSTKYRRPFKLIGYEAYLSKKESENREKYLKSSDGKKEIRKKHALSLQEITSHLSSAG